MGEWRVRLRDWWRGYTDEDTALALAKITGPHRPDSVICLTGGEGRAWRAFVAAQAQRDFNEFCQHSSGEHPASAGRNDP